LACLLDKILITYWCCCVKGGKYNLYCKAQY